MEKESINGQHGSISLNPKHIKLYDVLKTGYQQAHVVYTDEEVPTPEDRRRLESRIQQYENDFFCGGTDPESLRRHTLYLTSQAFLYHDFPPPDNAHLYQGIVRTCCKQTYERYGL